MIFDACVEMLAILILVFVYAGDGILKLAMLFVGRKQEYKANQFAIQAGFGVGLLSFLDKLKDVQVESPKGLFSRFYETHPATMSRIQKVEKPLRI